MNLLPWDKLEKSETYQKLDVASAAAVKARYFSEVQKLPAFQKMSKEQQIEYQNRFLSPNEDTEKQTDIVQAIKEGVKTVGSALKKQYDSLPESVENPLEVKTEQFDPTKVTVDNTGKRIFTDPLVSAAKGVVGTGESAVGLMRLNASTPEAKLGPIRASSPFDVGIEIDGVNYGTNPFKTAIDLLAKSGYNPQKSKDALNKLYTPEQQKALKNVDSAKGFFGSLGAMVENPSVIPHMIIESILPMLLGGGGAKALLGTKGFVQTIGKKWAPSVAAAIGEGGVATGSSAEQISQATGNKRLTPKQSLAALGTGLGTGALALAGASIARKLGFADFDTLLATGKTGKTSGSVIRRILEGGFSEGTLEELPQSVLEQLLMNVATDRPLTEGLQKAGAQGWVVGTAMGSGANIATSGDIQQEKETETNLPEQSAIEKRANNIISNGPEVTKTAISKLDKDINETNKFLKDPKTVEAKAAELETTVEDITTYLNEQLVEVTQLRDRLKKETGENVEDQLENEEINLNPSDAQKEAGNYKKASIKIDNHKIKIKNPDGSIRSGKDDGGNEWTSQMVGHYGYFERTEGKDGDQVDVFIKPNTTSSPLVYIVDQINPKTKKFDEHKIVIGANSAQEAKDLYMANYEDGWQGFGAIKEMSQDEFSAWLKDDKQHKKAVALSKETESSTFKNEQQVQQPELEEYSPEQIEALKGVTININETSIDAHEAYMNNVNQQETIGKLLDCLVN